MAADFEIERDTAGQFHQTVVGQRGAAFQTDGHGGDINFGQQIVREIGREIGVKSPVYVAGFDLGVLPMGD